MSQETREPADQLDALLAQLDEEAAKKLVIGLEADKLKGRSTTPFDLILRGVRPLLSKFKGQRPGTPNPLRLFCQPFEDMLFSGPRLRKQTGRISRESIVPVWTWLNEQLLPDTLPEISDHIVQHTLNGETEKIAASVAVLHATCAKAMMEALSGLEKDQAKLEALESRLGGVDQVYDAWDIANALSVAQFILALQRNLPTQIADLNDDLLRATRDLYEKCDKKHPGQGIYTLLAVMGRLKEPWQIMRLTRKIAVRNDDMMISQTDLSVLGEVMLSDLDIIAAKLSKRRAGQSDLEELLREAMRFAYVSKGLVSEIDIRRMGAWGQRLLTARQKVSTAISAELARFPRDLALALPMQAAGNYGRNGPRRPDISHAPHSERAPRVLAAARLLKGLLPIAESIGVHHDWKQVHQEWDAYLQTYGSGIIEEIHSAEGDRRNNAVALLELTAKVETYVNGSEAASILRRRGKVALKG